MTDEKPLDAALVQRFETTLQNGSAGLRIRRDDPGMGLKLLTRFNALKAYQRLYVHSVTELRGARDSFFVLLIEHHQHGRREHDHEEVEPVLIFSLPQDIGRVVIKPETLGDKLVDLIARIDIDFDAYPIFSRNYYVVGEKPELVRDQLPVNLIEALKDTKGCTVEINGRWGLLRMEKGFSEETLLVLMKVGAKLVAAVQS